MNTFSRVEPVHAQVVIHPAEVTLVDANSTLLLICVSYGVPVPSMTWFKDGVLLTNNSDVTITESVVVENQSGTRFVRSTVKICGTGDADSGLYECRAENEAGLSSYSTNLTVILGGMLSLFPLVQLHAGVYFVTLFIFRATTDCDPS